MKKLFLFCAAFCLAATASAQPAGKVRYQGELRAGFGMGAGYGKYDWIEFQTVHGVRVGRVFFCGAGIGLNRFVKYRYTYMPLFAEVKAYVGRGNTRPFFALDGGYAVYLGPSLNGGGDMSRHQGWLCPSWGLNCGIGSRLAVNFSMGYHIYLKRSHPDTMERGLVFRTGLQF